MSRSLAFSWCVFFLVLMTFHATIVIGAGSGNLWAPIVIVLIVAIFNVVAASGDKKNQ